MNQFRFSSFIASTDTSVDQWRGIACPVSGSSLPARNLGNLFWISFIRSLPIDWVTDWGGLQFHTYPLSVGAQSFSLIRLWRIRRCPGSRRVRQVRLCGTVRLGKPTHSSRRAFLSMYRCKWKWMEIESKEFFAGPDRPGMRRVTGRE